MPKPALTPEQRATLNTMIENSRGIHLLIASDHGSATPLLEPRVDFFRPGDRTFHLVLPDGSARDVHLDNIVEIHLRS
jgi:hypothetical protein